MSAVAALALSMRGLSLQQRPQQKQHQPFVSNATVRRVCMNHKSYQVEVRTSR